MADEEEREPATLGDVLHTLATGFPATSERQAKELHAMVDEAVGDEPDEAGADDDEPLTKAELRERAAELEIRGRSKMSPDELADAIAEAEAEAA